VNPVVDQPSVDDWPGAVVDGVAVKELMTGAVVAVTVVPAEATLLLSATSVITTSGVNVPTEETV